MDAGIAVYRGHHLYSLRDCNAEQLGYTDRFNPTLACSNTDSSLGTTAGLSDLA